MNHPEHTTQRYKNANGLAAPPMIKLKRHSDQPILTPDPAHPWEAAAVFNAAAVRAEGRIHLIYRATDITSNGSRGRYINALGYAVSEDGIHFQRRAQPVLTNAVPQEARGPEDPRIVKIGATFYMLYTGYGGRFDGDYRICLATSRDLLHWQRRGVMLDEPNKDAALFPRKIGGRYAMLHRRPPHIWIAFSEDLQRWTDHAVVMRALPGSPWECAKIGISGPPLETPQGWLLFYHGVSADRVYHQGIALLDLADPTQVLARQPEPTLEPELDWEIRGHVPNVVFSCGQVVIGETVYVYYAGADTAIGLATASLPEILRELSAAPQTWNP